MIFERKENKHITFNRLDAEIFFDDIFEDIKTPQELEWCVDNLIQALETAAHDWFEENEYKDQFDHCQIELYFDNNLEEIEE